jgi:photosystem II stability/assembly factor-like uncharacterized protein
MLLIIAMLFMHLNDNAPWWSAQPSVTDASLRGVSVVLATGKNDRLQYIVWASGSDGVILRSIDEGSTWRQISVPSTDGLDFRDIEAFSADEAYVMSSGEGKKSRVYKTTDAGKTWKLQYSGTTPGLFLDSMACDSETHCVALSDPVNGKFVVLSTNDGEHWSELPRDRMPLALAKEGAFAASGTAIVLCDRGGIYFGTGGPAARVFRSLDQGRSWTVSETPILSGTASSGIFSIACEGPDDLVAVGGDYKNANNDKRVAIYSAVASFSYGDFAAVGPNGTDISHDKGIHWQHTDKLNLNAIAFEGTNGWGVGPKGTVARFKTHFEYQIRREDDSRVVGAAR